MDGGEVKVRVVVFKDSEAWIAHCLDYDICAQGPDLETAKNRFAATLIADFNESMARNGAPFKGIDAAPSWVRDMWPESEGAFLAKGKMPANSGHAVEYEMAIAA
jgi:hypothetical protein